MNSVFHEGELAVQEKAGVSTMAARIGGMIKPEISAAASDFFSLQSFIVVASSDEDGHVWASVLTGWPGFVEVLDETTVAIHALPLESDPLAYNIRATGRLGLIAIEFATRRRMRLNGQVERHADRLVVHAEEVFGNCPKYIQARPIVAQQELAETAVSKSTTLSDEQINWIQNADTFFIATAHQEKGADASHRGGNPGFVQVRNGTLRFPDYSGNMMFLTLGNLASNPNSGLIFFDFAQGRILQVTGKSQILWDSSELAEFPGAERLISFEPEQVIETTNALPFSWEFESYSPSNPK